RRVLAHGYQGAAPATLTISGRQADISWLHLSRKQDRHWPRPEHYRRLPPFNHQTRGAHHDNHSSIRAEVATRPATKAHTGKTKSRHQEGPTGPPNAAEPVALSDLFPGRQSCRISSAVAPVIPGSGWCNRKGETNETGDPLPKPTAPTAQLQTKPCHSNSPGESAV